MISYLVWVWLIVLCNKLYFDDNQHHFHCLSKYQHLVQLFLHIYYVGLFSLQGTMHNLTPYLVFIVPYLWFLYALENGTVNKATAAAFHIFISHMIALGSSLPVLTFGSIPESTLTVPTQYFMWNWANSFRYCYSWHCWPCPFARWHWWQAQATSPLGFRIG